MAEMTVGLDAKIAVEHDIAVDRADHGRRYALVEGDGAGRRAACGPDLQHRVVVHGEEVGLERHWAVDCIGDERAELDCAAVGDEEGGGGQRGGTAYREGCWCC